MSGPCQLTESLIVIGWGMDNLRIVSFRPIKYEHTYHRKYQNISGASLVKQRVIKTGFFQSAANKPAALDRFSYLFNLKVIIVSYYLFLNAWI